MVQTAALYQFRYTVFNAGGAGLFQLVGPDPRRWYIRIRTSAGAGTVGMGPLPLPAGQVSFATVGNEVESKFRDAPSMTTGAWGCSTGGVARFDVWEQLYTGG